MPQIYQGDDLQDIRTKAERIVKDETPGAQLHHEALAESVLWREVAGVTDAVLDALLGEVDPIRWRAERENLFARHCPGNAPLCIRFEDCSRDLSVAIPNPMSAWDTEWQDPIIRADASAALHLQNFT